MNNRKPEDIANIVNIVRKEPADKLETRESPSPAPPSLGQYVGRLRRHKGIALAILLLATILTRVPDLPDLAALVAREGLTRSLVMDVLFLFVQTFFPALVFLTAFSLSVKSDAKMLIRPRRFFATLFISGTVAVAIAIEVAVIFGERDHFWNGDLASTVDILDIWMKFVLAGTLFGSLYFFYRKRSEDALEFATLLTRRSQLVRQVAQSNLLATRAQIDPEMIARILHRVRERYRGDADHATALLDNMISYLRLAMNRMRETAPSLSTELNLCQAYLTLYETETGRAIALDATHVNSPTRTMPSKAMPTVPLFLIVRQLLDQAMQADAKSIAVRVDSRENEIQVLIKIGDATISDDGLSTLRSGLEQLSLNCAIVLHHYLETGSNHYLVHISSRP